MNAMAQDIRAARVQLRDGGEVFNRGPIFVPGRPGWFALRCLPQREDAVERWLDARGVYAFHPVKSRVARRMGRVRRVEQRYLPGLVFARFPGAPVGHRVLAFPLLSDALRVADGRWGELRGCDLRRLHGMRSRDAAQDARAEALARAAHARRLQVGMRAMFALGPVADMPCEVVEVDGLGGARVRFTLFGREIEKALDASDVMGPDDDA
ncbi:transcription termination/antitermination NusG family protein [Jannaschia formosa]|uniref:transcription termination/antitermination NusG family protein n=1 Tax=Jannaschia formosa TaxID=2259592 RepID=UPI000E1BE90D|nr:transcription termination/antitermination NusG family protein [Jannaschia formosa]TFL16420.1 hypothetical protein DR046_20065 [Jannaschia formosa]